MAKINGRKVALDLLQYCINTGDWQPDYTNKPLGNLITFLGNQSDFAQYFNPHLAYELLSYDLAKPDWQEKPSVTDADAEQLLARLAENIKINAADHWIIVPLRDAELQSTIRFKDFAFIGGTRDEKIQALHRLCRISLQKVSDRAEHTETSRSPGVFCASSVSDSDQASNEYRRTSRKEICPLVFMRASRYILGVYLSGQSEKSVQKCKLCCR